MAKRQVIFAPSWEKANPYQNLLKAGIETKGNESGGFGAEDNEWKVTYRNYPSGFFPLNKLLNQNPKTYVLHVHWISELVMRVVWSKHPILFWFKILLFWLDCQLVKVRGVRLIWTLHNKFAHESQNKQRELILRRTLCRAANKIILHSQEALDEICRLYKLDIRAKTAVIFHGNYDGCYPNPSDNRDNLRAQYGIAPQETTLLYFGSIKPYKGVEQLIESFVIQSPSNVKLFVCGATQGEQHTEQLTQLCQGHKGIYTKYSFLDNQELVDYITLADAVVLPYSDTLTSGSVILAMTLGKALILPHSGKIFGVNPESGTHYFNKTFDVFAPDRTLLNINTLTQMGDINRLAATKLSWQEVGKATLSTYKGES